jgi:hypothetical protein
VSHWSRIFFKRLIVSQRVNKIPCLLHNLEIDYRVYKSTTLLYAGAASEVVKLADVIFIKIFQRCKCTSDVNIIILSHII